MKRVVAEEIFPCLENSHHTCYVVKCELGRGGGGEQCISDSKVESGRTLLSWGIYMGFGSSPGRYRQGSVVIKDMIGFGVTRRDSYFCN